MKILRLIFGCLIIFSITFTAFVGKNKIVNGGMDTTPTPYKGVISIWQVDSFEGGVGSRKQFLLKIARWYEKNNDGVLFMVTNQTEEGVKESIKNGELPDIISFGTGVDVSGFSQINIDRVSKGGKIGEECFAVAWCRGGYFLIYNPSIVSNVDNIKEIENLLVSQGQFTQPLTALTMQGIVAKNIEVKKPMDAYVKFVEGKTPFFLATQRDIFRLKNRGYEFGAVAITEFNDLYQYAVITSTDQTKRFYAQSFLQFLLEDKAQQSLSSIGMFSDFTKVDYQDDCLLAIQSAKPNYTLSAFTDAKILHELQSVSIQAVCGEKDALNKIKKLLV